MILLELSILSKWNMEILVGWQPEIVVFGIQTVTSGEAFSEIKDQTGVANYNVRLTMTFPEGEGAEKKEV